MDSSMPSNDPSQDRRKTIIKFLAYKNGNGFSKQGELIYGSNIETVKFFIYDVSKYISLFRIYGHIKYIYVHSFWAMQLSNLE